MGVGLKLMGSTGVANFSAGKISTRRKRRNEKNLKWRMENGE
jgi:hypothetical protein